MATILCIEDETHLREDIIEDLEDAGHQTYQAQDGHEGLEMILQHEPDVVVSDISMPRMDGHQLVRTLREEHPQFCDMPFIFLTAFNDKKDVVDGLRIGADDYLTKPVDYELLQFKIASALRQSGRMIERREEEQVRLYKALASEEEAPCEEESPSYRLPARKCVLVGESEPEFLKLRKQLEELGQTVHVFTSGRAFLEKADMLEADIVLLWLQSDDMQAPMIATMNKSRGTMTVVALPARMRGPMTEQKMNGVEELIALPLTKGQLATKLATWIAELNARQKEQA